MDGSVYRVLSLRLREHRRRAGLTLEQLGERAGITGPFVAHIEAGRKRPTLHTVAKLARALRTPIASLIEEDGGSDGSKNRLQEFSRCLAGLSDRQQRALLELLRAACALARRR